MSRLSSVECILIILILIFIFSLSTGVTIKYCRLRLIGTGLFQAACPNYAAVLINRNILVWTVYWDRLVPGSLSRLTEIS